MQHGSHGGGQHGRMVKTRVDGRIQVRGKRVVTIDNDESPIPRAHGVGKPAWLEAQAAARGRDRTVPARIKVWQESCSE